MAKAVIISDVHCNLQTLELADAAMNQAIDLANKLQVPLIVAGDLHDSKANMRAECVNRMLTTIRKAHKCYILRGNHDQINEKSEEHALNFLNGYSVTIIDEPAYNEDMNLYMIPYQHDINKLISILKETPEGSTLVMHQGITGSNSGEYIQDKTALIPEDVTGFRVISGHYHARQTIRLPKGGVWDFIGNPYTLTFGEANDPEKGFRVLHSDGSLQFVPTKLRRHVVYGISNSAQIYTNHIRSNDLLWVKVTGTKEFINEWDKKAVTTKLNITQPFRYEAIPTTNEHVETKTNNPDKLIDIIIDTATNIPDTQKTRLKTLWRNL
jgi:DNA repair exonuclease SbcCD nuclease subunit